MTSLDRQPLKETNICSDDQGYQDLFAFYTDWLLFHHKWSLKTLILSRKQDPYRYYATSCVLIQSSPLDFHCRLCFYHVIISINDCMYFCFCMYICYCLQHAVPSVFFQVCSTILPTQLLHTCILGYVIHVHDHAIYVTNLIIPPEDSILIRRSIQLLFYEYQCRLWHRTSWHTRTNLSS